MSFYVTLPSNSSRDVYPENTMTKFTTKLKTPIRLEGSYEVALVEMIYPISWKYRVDGAIVLKYEDLKVYCEVKFYAYETLTDLIGGLQEYFNNSEIQIEIRYNTKSQKVHFILPDGVVLNFVNGVERELGFKLSEYKGKADVVINGDRKVRDVLNTINSLYIYTDIVEYQIVGDVNAPLLQVVSANTQQNEAIVDKIYDSPHYVPVLRNNIETIEIDIRSDSGRSIYFTSGRVVVKLHFRRKSFY